MNWLGALLAGAALLAVAVVIGLAWTATSGRVRRTADTPTPAHGDGPAAVLGIPTHDLGTRATLVQLSTEFCSRCPGTARKLAGIAAEFDGVRHIEVDITNRADLADRFRVLQTPTTLILGPDGAATARIGGAPRGDEVRNQLDRLTRSHRVQA